MVVLACQPSEKARLRREGAPNTANLCVPKTRAAFIGLKTACVRRDAPLKKKPT